MWNCTFTNHNRTHRGGVKLMLIISKIKNYLKKYVYKMITLFSTTSRQQIWAIPLISSAVLKDKTHAAFAQPSIPYIRVFFIRFSFFTIFPQIRVKFCTGKTFTIWKTFNNIQNRTYFLKYIFLQRESDR